MEFISDFLQLNLLSYALILGIIIMLIENRRERPHGTDHVIAIVVMLTVIVINASLRDLYLMRGFDSERDYRNDVVMTMFYLRTAIEHILFPMIAYVELLLIAPVQKKNILFIPEAVCIVSEIVNLASPGIIFRFNKHLGYGDGPLMMLPYFVGMIYLLLLMRYSILFIKEKELSKGVTVIFIVFLTLAECYLECLCVSLS